MSKKKSNKEVIEFVINNGIFSDMIIKFRNDFAEYAADVAASYIERNGYDFASNKVYEIALNHFSDFSKAKDSLSNDTYGRWVAETMMTEFSDWSEYDDMSDDDLSEFNEITGVSLTEFFNLNEMTINDFLSLVEDWNEIVVEKSDDTEESEMLHRASMTRLANLMLG